MAKKNRVRYKMKVEKHLKQKYQTEASATKTDGAMMAHIRRMKEAGKRKYGKGFGKIHTHRITHCGRILLKFPISTVKIATRKSTYSIDV